MTEYLVTPAGVVHRVDGHRRSTAETMYKAWDPAKQHLSPGVRACSYCLSGILPAPPDAEFAMTYEEIASRAIRDHDFADGLRAAVLVCRSQHESCPAPMLAVYLESLSRGTTP